MTDDALAAGFSKKYPVYAQELASTPEQAAQIGISQKQAAQAPLLAQAGQATGGNLSRLVPFIGASDALTQGFETGEKALGDNAFGTSLGALIAAAQVAGTAFNPITGGLEYVTKVGGQAIPQALAGEGQMALQSLMGTTPVQSVIQPRVTESTAENFISDLLSQAAQDPMNAGFMAAGLGVPKVAGAIRQSPAMVAAPIDAATALGRRAVAIPESALASSKQAIAERGIFRQPLAAATTEAIGITPIKGAAEMVPVVKSSILEANAGKLPENLPPAQILENALDFKINQYKDGLKVAEDIGMRHSTESLKNAMRNHLRELYEGMDDIGIESVIDSVVKDRANAGIFSKDFITPTEGQRFAVQVNRDVNVKNPNRVPKSNEQLNAETALSQELSRQGSEMYQAATDTTATPNQDWGVLKSTQNSLTKELDVAQRGDAGKTPGGEAIPLTWTGLLNRSLRRVGGRALVSTNAEDMASAFNRGLKEWPSRPSPVPIDPAFKQGIIQRYTPQEVSKPLTSLIESPSSLEDLIQKTIKGLPKSFRGSNERNLAEIMVRSGTPLP